MIEAVKEGFIVHLEDILQVLVWFVVVSNILSY